MRSWGRFIILLVLALGAGGCDLIAFKGAGADDAHAAVAPGRWPFMPVGIRMHPFTSIKFDEKDKRHVLDARIEMVDRVGDLTKGVGDFRVELYRDAGTASGARVDRQQLYAWEVEMTTVEQNQRYYDPLTRAYTFRLAMAAPPDDDDRLVVEVQFTDLDGRRLTAKAELDADRRATRDEE